MKSVLVFAFVFFVFGFAQAQTAVKTKSRVTKSDEAGESNDEDSARSRKNLTPSTLETSLYFELLGRDLVYGIGIEKPLTSNKTIGLTLSYMTWDFFSVHITDYFLNPYFTIYTGDRHRLFGTVGLMLIYDTVTNNPVTVTYSDGTSQKIDGGIEHASGLDAFPQIGGGYEFRTTGGFIFRASLYLTYIHKYSDQSAQIFPWGGLTFGATL